MEAYYDRVGFNKTIQEYHRAKSDLHAFARSIFEPQTDADGATPSVGKILEEFIHKNSAEADTYLAFTIMFNNVMDFYHYWLPKIKIIDSDLVSIRISHREVNDIPKVFVPSDDFLVAHQRFKTACWPVVRLLKVHSSNDQHMTSNLEDLVISAHYAFIDLLDEIKKL